jgi:hypothetical protein
VGQNVIELNGKRYDAITGAYLGKANVIPKHITEQYIHGRVVDGFVRPSRPAPKPQASPAEAKPKAAQPMERKTMADVAARQHPSRTPVHVKHHQPEKSTTLMRRAIKKPEFSLKPAIKTQAPAEIMAKPASAIAHKRSAYGVDPVRHQRAAEVNRHHAVRHFGHPTVHAVSATVPVIPVRPTPPVVAVRQPAPAPTKHHADIFEAAIAHATSHEQPAHKHRKHRSTRRKFVNALAVVGTFLVIGGFVGYLNLPQLQLRVASVQAGFGASMPGYAPTGFALQDGVERSGSTVTLSFRSGDQAFRITQQPSNWNSQTLLDNTLALSDKYETVQKNGQTIYLYQNDGTNAAWVNGGVRYDLTGNADLSKQEIADIATSM